MRCLLPSFSFVLLLFLFASVTPANHTSAAAMTDIRIGLTSLYGSKNTISIYNNSVEMGYCTGNTFVSTDSFSSSGGFSFTADNSDYYICPDEYTTFSKALKYSKELNQKGMTALPVSIGRKSWSVYVLNDRNVTDSIKNNQRTGERETKNTVIKVNYSGGSFLSDSYSSGYFPQYKASDNSNTISLGTRSYRGRIEIIAEKQKVTAVNIISVEAYLLGVVTCEMDKQYPTEALKAQTIAARSYAIAKAGFSAQGTKTSRYKLTDNTASQVYKGINGESEQARSAVKATMGQVLKNDGSIVEAFYFSTSGGSTDSISDIWGISDSVFDRKFDIYEKNPERDPWIVDYSFDDIRDILSDNEKDIGSITKITPSITTAGGRVYSLRIIGTKSKILLGINEIQDYFGLPSTKFKVITSSGSQNTVSVKSSLKISDMLLANSYTISADNGIKKLSDSLEQYILVSDDNMSNIVKSLPPEGHIYFAGMGYGHGVGMSQSGAAGMADAGYDYKDILNFYYTNVTIGNYND